MSHHIPENHLMPKGLVAFSSYTQLSDVEKQKAILDNFNTERTIGSIENGYKAYLAAQEKNHSENIDVMRKQTKVLDARMSAMVAQQEFANTKLVHMAENARLPEIEKERFHHIDEGTEYLKQAQKNPERYNDALCSFLNAEEINNKDYIEIGISGSGASLKCLISSNNFSDVLCTLRSR